MKPEVEVNAWKAFASFALSSDPEVLAEIGPKYFLQVEQVCDRDNLHEKVAQYALWGASNFVMENPYLAEQLLQT